MSTRHSLWDLVDIGKCDLPSFLRILNEAPEQQLIDFYWQHGEARRHLYLTGGLPETRGQACVASQHLYIVSVVESRCRFQTSREGSKGP